MSPRIGWLQRLLLVALAASLMLGTAATPAAASTPIVKLALTVSPSPAVFGGTITITGTVTRLSGSPRNVRVHMESNWYGGGGTCSPAQYCTVDISGAYWTLPSVTTKVTVRFTTTANPGRPIRFYLDAGAGCDTSCPAIATVALPTLSIALTYTADSWPVMPGTTLHVSVRGSTNASPVLGDLQGDLGPGLDPPTNVVPASALYSPPPANYIDDAATLAPTSVLQFDTKVTAAVGSNVTLGGYFFPADSYAIPSRTVTVHVGPATTYQESSSRIHWVGTWHRQVYFRASGGATRYTTAPGASASITFTGWSFAWIAPVGPTRGSARVYVDGTRVRTVSLYRSAGRNQQMVYLVSWPTRRTHTIKIVNVATSGHPRVDVDAFLVVR